jgi:hypothetical protein
VCERALLPSNCFFSSNPSIDYPCMLAAGRVHACMLTSCTHVGYSIHVGSFPSFLQTFFPFFFFKRVSFFAYATRLFSSSLQPTVPASGHANLRPRSRHLALTASTPGLCKSGPSNARGRLKLASPHLSPSYFNHLDPYKACKTNPTYYPS